MVDPLARKTFRVQFDVTVEMAEIQQHCLPSPLAPRAPEFLKHLQQAVVDDEAALQAVMRAALAGKLQEYVDYLAAQDDQPAVLRAAERLEGKDARFLRLHRDDFEALSALLRVSSLSVRVDDSRIEEKVAAPAPEAPGWRVVWRDLLQSGRLGRLLEKLSFPVGRLMPYGQPQDSHFLLLGYVTQELDGVHVAGRCTCDQVFDGMGEDESQALETVWAAFQVHHRKYQPCG